VGVLWILDFVNGVILGDRLITFLEGGENMLVTVNYLAVLVAAVATMVVGFIWYGPMLFGKTWMRAIGADPNDKEKMEQMKKGMSTGYALTFVASLVSAYILAIFIGRIGSGSIESGCKIAFAAWLGFVVPIKLGDAIFSGKPRQQSMTMFWLGAGYQLVSFLAMGVIIAAWM